MDTILLITITIYIFKSRNLLFVGFDTHQNFGTVAGDWCQIDLFFLFFYFMPHFSCIGELQYNPEIEKAAQRLRKEAKFHKQISSSLSLELDFTVDSIDSSSDTEIEQEIANVEKTFKGIGYTK